MANNRFQKKSKKAFLIAKIQKLKLLKSYDFISCHQKNDKLTCKGEVSPNGCGVYKFSIIYRVGTAPKVYIKEPQIAYHKDIHMYQEGNLCLYFPNDMPWDDDIMIANTFVPWMIEWIIFYELWLRTKTWLGKSAPHGIVK